MTLQPFQYLQRLEGRASELDHLALTDQDIDVAATLSAKRRFLLHDLQSEGFLDADVDDKDPAFEPYPVLQSYMRAALKLRAYYASDARRQYVSEPAPGSLIIGPISLDWFRSEQPVADGFSQEEWLARCEYTFRNIELGQGGGQIFFRGGNLWCTLTWRFDDGIHPGFYKVSVKQDL